MQHIEAVISELPTRGLAVLLVEQFVDFAVEVCDRYTILERGAVVAEGATSELRQDLVDAYLAV